MHGPGHKLRLGQQNCVKSSACEVALPCATALQALVNHIYPRTRGNLLGMHVAMLLLLPGHCDGMVLNAALLSCASHIPMKVLELSSCSVPSVTIDRAGKCRVSNVNWCQKFQFLFFVWPPHLHSEDFAWWGEFCFLIPSLFLGRRRSIDKAVVLGSLHAQTVFIPANLQMCLW